MMAERIAHPHLTWHPARRVLRVVLALAILGSGSHSASAQEPKSAEAPAQKAAPKRAKATPTSEAQAPPTKRDPAAAQANVDAAAKLLEAGKTDQAVASLSGAISGGNLPPTIMARALYLRGTAYRKQAKPGLAISDLTSALWLKGGLNDADRADATQQRAAAYSEAGLGDQGQPTSAAAQSAASRKRSDGTTANLTPDSNAATASTNSGGGFFEKLFGGNSSANTPAPTPATAAPAPTPDPKPQRAAAVAPPPEAQQPPAPTKQARIAAATVATGAFQARVALAKTRAEADTVVAKLKGQYASAIGDKTPTVGETSFGAMGTFFQVRVGPFANAAEATAMCGRIKGSGLDCVAVNN